MSIENTGKRVSTGSCFLPWSSSLESRWSQRHTTAHLAYRRCYESALPWALSLSGGGILPKAIECSIAKLKDGWWMCLRPLPLHASWETSIAIDSVNFQGKREAKDEEANAVSNNGPTHQALRRRLHPVGLGEGIVLVSVGAS